MGCTRPCTQPLKSLVGRGFDKNDRSGPPCVFFRTPLPLATPTAAGSAHTWLLVSRTLQSGRSVGAQVPPQRGIHACTSTLFFSLGVDGYTPCWRCSGRPSHPSTNRTQPNSICLAPSRAESNCQQTLTKESYRERRDHRGGRHQSTSQGVSSPSPVSTRSL